MSAHPTGVASPTIEPSAGQAAAVSAPATHLLSWVALAQAFFYGVTGLWPILSISTFMAVTGPKTDIWLVKTVAALVIVVAVVLIVAVVRRNVGPEMMVLSIGSALALTSIDFIYVPQRIIRPVYLLDAVAELLLVALWLSAWKLAHRRSGQQDM